MKNENSEYKIQLCKQMNIELHPQYLFGNSWESTHYHSRIVP